MTTTGSIDPIGTSLDDASRYDFKPFLSAPAVVERAKQGGGVIRPLHIPGSKIPSPLARDISPDQLLGVKESLVGSGPATSSRTGNGGEVWLSWKRAWDLWNNHYIHGRVNPIWVKGEFEKRQNQGRQYSAFDKASGDGKDGEIQAQDHNGPATDTQELDEGASSGGFQAIKDFPKFKAPPPFDPDFGDDGIVWDDLINNTVWAPRRVGEKTVKVDLDVDLDEFQRNSDLERDRGVDCGRLPYPALRSLIKHIQLESGAIVKKKVWDGVTGTVFNLPIKPLEPTQKPEDEKSKRVGQMFGDVYRDFKPITANEDIFPLDIRRVKRVYPPPIFPKRIPPLLSENSRDARLYNRLAGTDLPVIKHREMSEEDPWYVTEEQRVLIDNPPRRYPPPEQKYKSVDIPVDDTIFREEFDSDQLEFTNYFVTNHQRGATLIVNGVEVQKGDIAGPLPEFAVIECPGGQVAFWFGSYGRNYLARTEESPHIKWLALRQRDGWKYTGLSAGQVWNAKIKDRIERKKHDADEDDDEQWEEWLSATAPEEPSAPTSVSYQLPLPGQSRGVPLPLPDNIAQPHVVFPSEQDELAWISAQLIEKDLNECGMDIDLLPGEVQFFPGSKLRSDYVENKGLTQKMVDDIWVVNGEDIQALQQAHIASIWDEEKGKAQVEEEGLKSIRPISERKDEVKFRSRRIMLRTAANALHPREPEPEQESEQNLERDPEDLQEAIKKSQHDWDRYTSRKRAKQRKQKEKELAMLDRVRKPDKENLVAKHGPLADEEVKRKIRREKKEAMRVRQLQMKKHKKKSPSEELLEKIYHFYNDIDPKTAEKFEQLDEIITTQSNHQTTNDIQPKQKPSQSTASEESNIYNSIDNKTAEQFEQPEKTTTTQSNHQTTTDIEPKEKPSQSTTSEEFNIYNSIHRKKAAELEQQKKPSQSTTSEEFKNIYKSILSQKAAEEQLKASTGAKGNHQIPKGTEPKQKLFQFTTTLNPRPSQKFTSNTINDSGYKNKPPSFATSLYNFDLTSAPPVQLNEDEAILQAMEQSKQMFRGNAEQEITQAAIAAFTPLSEYLEELGFSSMEQCLDDYTNDPLADPEASKAKLDPIEQDLESFKASLKQAYADGSKARAKLRNISWESYTLSISNRAPRDYLDFMVQSIDITTDHMPTRLNKDMDITEEAVSREKWSMLNDLLINASDFESQTQAANLPPQKHTSVHGERFAVL